MRRAFASALLMGALSVIGFSGCGEESSMTDTETIETPEGTKEVTTETTIEATGDMTADPATTPAP